MKFLILLNLFSALVAVTLAATSIGVFKNPLHPNKCVVFDKILSPGEEAQLTSSCGRILCGGESKVQIHTCGAQMPQDGYVLGEPINPNADYPGCCERVQIKVNN